MGSYMQAVFNSPVACVYLGACPRMEPVGRRLPWVILSGSTGWFYVIMCTEATELVMEEGKL